jgi:hypothetical protein
MIDRDLLSDDTNKRIDEYLKSIIKQGSSKSTIDNPQTTDTTPFRKLFTE